MNVSFDSISPPSTLSHDQGQQQILCKNQKTDKLTTTFQMFFRWLCCVFIAKLITEKWPIRQNLAGLVCITDILLIYPWQLHAPHRNCSSRSANISESLTVNNCWETYVDSQTVFLRSNVKRMRGRVAAGEGVSIIDYEVKQSAMKIRASTNIRICFSYGSVFVVPCNVACKNIWYHIIKYFQRLMTMRG